MNLEVDDEDIPPHREPKIGDTPNCWHISVGKGTCGLGKKYATPMIELQRAMTLHHELQRLECNYHAKLEAQRQEAMERKNYTYSKIAEDRRMMKLIMAEQKNERLKRLQNERQKQRDQEKLEAIRQEELKEERKRELTESKRQWKETRSALKEEHRREMAHQRMDQQEQQVEFAAAERKIREDIQERIGKKVAQLREEALTAKRSAVQSVQDLQAKQKAKAKADTDAIQSKISERRKAKDQERMQNIKYIRELQTQHHTQMDVVSHERNRKLDDCRHQVLTPVPEAEAIQLAREKQRSSLKKYVSERREERRAKSVYSMLSDEE